MSDWKNVQYKGGKFKTGTGGGGGSSTFAGLNDVNFNNLQNGQVPKYNSTTQKWENANESGGGGGLDCEVITFGTGDGSTSRTFTFSKVPKYVKITYYSSSVGWVSSGSFIWGDTFMIVACQPKGLYNDRNDGCQVNLTYSQDNKSVTIAHSNPYVCFNSRDNSTDGKIFVIY